MNFKYMIRQVNCYLWSFFRNLKFVFQVHVKALAAKRPRALQGKSTFPYLAVVTSVDKQRKKCTIRFQPRFHPKGYNHTKSYRWPFSNLKKVIPGTNDSELQTYIQESFLNCDSWNDPERGEAIDPADWDPEEEVSKFITCNSPGIC